MISDKFNSIFDNKEADLSKSNLKLEKNDLLAIIIAAFTSMLPVIFLVFSLFAVIIFFLFFK